MLARVTNIRFPPSVKAEVVGVARGLVPIMKERQGFHGLQVMTNPDVGEGVMVSFWETEDDAEASESSPSYIGQVSMMSSFLSERLAPETYEVDVLA